MAKVKVRGLAVIDRRTLPAQALLQWRKELLADLGGEENLSAQKLALVEMIVRGRLFIDHLDAYLLSQESLVNKRSSRRCRERQALTDSLARLLGQLGLERQAKPMPSLSEYISSKEAAQ